MGCARCQQAFHQCSCAPGIWRAEAQYDSRHEEGTIELWRGGWLLGRISEEIAPFVVSALNQAEAATSAAAESERDGR